MFNKIPDGEFCPLTSGACIKQGCKFWVHISGKHPQSGAKLDMPDCAVKWLPILMIEAAQESRETAAAVESFRNEMVQSNAQSVVMLATMAARKALSEG